MPVIAREQVIDLFLHACPSFESSEHWRTYDADWGQEREQPLYLFASSLVLHLAELNAAGHREEFADVFAVIDRMHTEGDRYVRELATIGLLEDLQNTNFHPTGSDPSDFVAFLSAVSRWWWDEVELFWEGKIAYVGSSSRPKPIGTPDA